MIKRNVFLSCLLFGVVLLISSCDKEARLNGWLTKNGGEWEVYGSSARIIEYLANGDSAISNAYNAQNIGTFRFFSPQQCETDFELVNLAWQNTYTYTHDESGFRILATGATSAMAETKLDISGYRSSNRTLHVDFRHDTFYPNNSTEEGRIVITADLELERK